LYVNKNFITDVSLDKEVRLNFGSCPYPDPNSGYGFWIRKRFTLAEASAL